MRFENYEKEIEMLIFKINNSSINETTAKNELFGYLDKIFSYFYNKKVYLKKIKNLQKKEKLKQLFSKIDLDKVDKIFFILENIELHKKINFTNIEGVNLLRRLKAKYSYSKRFFKN